MSIFAWFMPWEPSFLLLLIASGAAFLYIRGSLAVAVPWGRQILFWLGFVSIYAVSHTQFDYYAEHEFFMERVQHSFVHHLSPFLIALSGPGAVLIAGMSPRLRLYWNRCRDNAVLRHIFAFSTHPVTNVLVFSALIVLWLVPGVHFIAMLDWRLYRVMNWSMAINGLLFWSTALNPHSRFSPWARIGMMLAVIPVQVAVGALLFFSAHELYPIYSICGRAFGDLTPVADQQIGGLVVWIHGGMMSVIGILIVLLREMKPPRIIALPVSSGHDAQA